MNSYPQTCLIRRKTAHRLRPRVYLPNCLLLALGAALASRPVHGADQLSSYTPAQIVRQVTATYQRVTSAQGRIARTVEAGGRRVTYTGRFAVLKPDQLFVEFVGDNHQLTFADRDWLRVYFPGLGQGIYQERHTMHPFERFMTGPEPLFGNLLQLVTAEHSLTLADTVDSHLILKMTPRSPSPFGFTLAAIDPLTWTLRAVEHFGAGGDLLSQTRFLSFAVVGDSLYFPTETFTTTQPGETMSQETTRFTRVALNQTIPLDIFEPPDDPGIEWISHQAFRER